MSDACILAIDQGTTSSRAFVFDHAGAIVSSARRDFTQHFAQPGWVEHDALEIWQSVQAVVHEALAAARGRTVEAIGITNQRETTVVWDRRSGKPIHHAIVWQSRQTRAHCDDLIARGHDALVRARTGLLIDAYFSATKIRWILDHVPGARERARRGDLLFGTIDSWLVWNLTGGAAHVTDASNASRTLLYDIHTCRWDDELLALFEVPAAMLPEVRASSQVYGHTALFTPLALPIAGIAGDQQAALFGQACFTPGMAKNTYGTGCFLLMHTGAQPVASRHGLLTTIAWSLNGQIEYALEGSIFVAGSVVQWLRDGLGLIGSAEESTELAERLASNEGVYLVPAFVGLGAPYWRSDVRGAAFGLTRGTRREHLVRAGLEAMAYQTRDVLAAMQADAGLEMHALRVDGGAIANGFLAQFQADLLGVPVQRARHNEATAFGAACLAGIATGFWRDRDEIAALWQAGRAFVPTIAAHERNALYAGWQRAVAATLEFRVS
ncbi:MAG: glycerol kinase GlpK [Rudaea sp.]